MKFRPNEVYKGLIYQGKDYSDRLEVSNFGNIRNSKTKHVYKQSVNNTTGYLGVCISLGSRDSKKLFKTHKAVAESFIPNPNNLPIVNHKDGVKTNCCSSNLEWCTHSYNGKHAYKMGLILPCKGQSHHSSKLSKEDIEYIRLYYKPRDRQYGARALGRKFNVYHTAILAYV